MRRLVMVWAIAALMAALMVANAMPAFAQGGPGGCQAPGTLFTSPNPEDPDDVGLNPQDFGQGESPSAPPPRWTIGGDPFPSGVADNCTPSQNNFDLYAPTPYRL